MAAFKPEPQNKILYGSRIFFCLDLCPSNMADETMPMIPKAENIYIHTGNITALPGLSRKINQAPCAEVSVIPLIFGERSAINL